MLVKIALNNQSPIVRVDKANLAQKQVIQQQEENNKVVHVSRPADSTQKRIDQPVRIVEK